MVVYGVSGVKLDAHGRVEQVHLGSIDVTQFKWIESPINCELHKVANLISTGYEIYSIFIVGGKNMVQGPKFCVVEYEHGVKGIALEKDIAGMCLRDLVMS